MKKIYLSMVLIVGLFVSMASFAMAVNGASDVTVGDSSSALATPASSADAIAGNVTELTISGKTSTQSWQGYFGNVSGTIELANGLGDVMYNWSAANPSGEVLASVAQNVDWVNLGCFDLATDGAALESSYNIDADAVDGVNETFTGTADIITAGKSLTGCSSAEIFDETGSSNGVFVETLLTDGVNPVFASILENDELGFDNSTHDFEMLVLEDGHLGDTTPTTYYFFVELE